MQTSLKFRIADSKTTTQLKRRFTTYISITLLSNQKHEGQKKQNLEKAKFDFTVDIKKLLDKLLVDAYLLHLIIRMRCNYKDRAFELSVVSNYLTGGFGLTSAGHIIVILKNL